MEGLTESGLRLQYLVDIFNQGPGFLPLASVQIRLPIYTKDMKPIVQIYSIEVNHVLVLVVNIVATRVDNWNI